MKKFFLLVSIFLLIPVIAFAKNVTATGMGGSEKTALKDAMRLAIENALGVYITSQTSSEDYMIIKDKINSHAEGYIKSYEVLEKTLNNGIYSVTINADVRDDISNIIFSDKEKRAKIKAGLSDPKIAVFATDSQKKRSTTAENAFMEALRKIGFSKIVSSKNNADFFLEISINKKATGATGGNFIVNAKITKTKTGEIIFTGSESAIGAGAAGRKHAVKRAAEKIINKIDRRTMELASTPQNNITLIITKLRPNIASTENYLKELPGVENIVLRRMNNNFSEYTLDFTGDATDFAKLLEKRGIKIQSVERDIVRI